MTYEDFLINNLKGDEKVLEIGRRSSYLIAKILKESSNLVSLETDEEENVNKENVNFHIEKYSELFIDNGYECLINKYGINFDTIIISNDAVIFAVFLYKYPELLHNINLVIIYNDFYDIYHYLYIKHNLINNCFRRVISYELYEVWNRIN